MDFGIVLQTDPPGWQSVELTALSERHGFTHAWAFDSHVLWQEAFVIFSQMLSNTKTMIVGPMVTNPGTRDWTVTASLFATLNEMFGNRTICGIGRGDSALRVIGRQPCSLESLSTAMSTIKLLAEGKEVSHNGLKQRLAWCKPTSRLPMLMAGYGPRALDLCGREADGFILQLADPQIVEWTIRSVKAAAVEAGRDPESLYFCVAAPAYVGENITHQREQVRWFGGMVGNHVVELVDRYGTSNSDIPSTLTEYIKARKGYDYSEHGRSGSDHTSFVPDDVIDRFCILGSADNHIDRLQELSSLGVDQFAIYLMHDDRETTLSAYGTTVIPSL